MCIEFFDKLTTIKDHIKLDYVVTNWHYFLEIIKYSKINISLTEKEELKKKFFSAVF